MDTILAKQAAVILYEAWQETKSIDSLPDHLKPRTLDDGYQIQEALEFLHGVPVAGYKIGATNKVAQKMFDVNAPFFGRIFAPSIQESPGVVKRGSIILHIIEAEFDFTFKRALPSRARRYTISEIMDSVDSLIPAIEIPDSRYRDWRNAGMAQLVADNAIASLLVLGKPAENWRNCDLSCQSVKVFVNDALVDEGSGANVLGDPRNVLQWLVNELSKRGMGIKEGQVVTTGSAADVIKVNAGDKVVADFGDLGTVETTFS